jgi:hypothetical protein
MTTLPPISLNDHWTVDGHEIPSLSNWVLEPSAPDHLSFRRDFDLEPLDICVRYALHLDGVPGPVMVELGGAAVGGPGEHVIDVTDHVALEDNQLVLTLDLSGARSGDRFGDVWLEAIPCDD